MNANSTKYADDTTWIKEISDWRGQVFVPEYRYGAPTWNRQGVQGLVDEAKAHFEKVSGVSLPYNLSTHGPWVGYSWRNRLAEDKEEMVSYAARFAGWLKKAAELRGLVRLIARTTSTNGMNSPYTELDIYRLFDRFSSPHSAERKLWKVLHRANQILAPYGISVSYAGLAYAMSHGDRRTGKSARRAAEATVSQYVHHRFGEQLGLIQARGLKDAVEAPEGVRHWAAQRVIEGEFESLREAMAHADRLVEDNSDGVELYLDPFTSETVHNVSVTTGWGHDGMIQELCRQEHTGRTYHAENRGGWRNRTTRDCAKDALKAWKEQ